MRPHHPGRFIATSVLMLASSAAAAQDAPDSPQVFASPINAGCYIAGPDDCRIHVDPFTININDGAGARLVMFELYANGKLIYSFRTDVSNPPATDYSPSPVAMDFAATCGISYSVNVIGRDTLDSNPLNMGQTAAFTCPSAVP